MITVEEELMSAVSEGDKERVGQLLLEGVDPNVFPPMVKCSGFRSYCAGSAMSVYAD